MSVRVALLPSNRLRPLTANSSYGLADLPLENGNAVSVDGGKLPTVAASTVQHIHLVAAPRDGVQAEPEIFTLPHFVTLSRR